MMKMFKLITALLLCCMTIVVNAESSALTKLDQLLSRWKTLSADFTQRSIDSEGDVLETYKGHIYLNKPNRLRWIISEPEKQLVVADGKNIWIYDEELEQVTVQPLSTQLSETPALFLSGEFKSISEGFNVQSISDKKFRVTPKKQDTLMEYMILSFDKDDRLVGMQLKDVFGQTTDLTFTKIQINPALDPSLFVFSPAKGVDVVGEAQ